MTSESVAGVLGAIVAAVVKAQGPGHLRVYLKKGVPRLRHDLSCVIPVWPHTPFSSSCPGYLAVLYGRPDGKGWENQAASAMDIAREIERPRSN